MPNLIDYAGLAFRIVQHKDEIEELVSRLMPYVNMAKKDFPALFQLGERLFAELLPEQFGRTIDNKIGVINFDVKWVQESLNVDPYVNPKVDLDGDMGPSTIRAIKQFQVAHDLKIVDGWVGPDTFRALFEARSKGEK